MSAPEHDPDATTLAHLAGEAFTEGITDMTRDRLSAWTPEQVARIPAEARHRLALGPFCAMGLVAFADGRFDETELDAIADWLEDRTGQEGPLALLWSVGRDTLPELRLRARRPDQWESDLSQAIQTLVSWVEVGAREPWLSTVHEAAEAIAGASSDGGLLAEYFKVPVSDDERMVITSIEHLLEAARMAD